jgi:hypothetical protein
MSRFSMVMPVLGIQAELNRVAKTPGPLQDLFRFQLLDACKDESAEMMRELRNFWRWWTRHDRVEATTYDLRKLREEVSDLMFFSATVSLTLGQYNHGLDAGWARRPLHAGLGTTEWYKAVSEARHDWDAACAALLRAESWDAFRRRVEGPQDVNQPSVHHNAAMWDALSRLQYLVFDVDFQACQSSYLEKALTNLDRWDPQRVERQLREELNRMLGTLTGAPLYDAQP